jgi:hypothetical protein
MYRRIFLLFLGISLAGSTGVWGQPAHEMGGPGFQERLLEIKRTQLGPALGVNQQTVDRLLQIDQRYKPMRHQMIMEMKNDWHRLQQLMSHPAPSEAEVQTVLGHMKSKRLEMLNLQQRQGDEEMALLTPIQQARYLIYLRSLIREARSIKGGPSREMPTMPGAPGPPREIPVSRPPR